MGYSDGYFSNADCYPQTLCNKKVNFTNCLQCIKTTKRKAITCTKLAKHKDARIITQLEEWKNEV